MHPTTFLYPETLFSLLLISWLIMLALGSYLGTRGLTAVLAYHQGYKNAKTKELVANLSNECAKHEARDRKHIQELAKKDEQIAKKVATLKQAEQEIKLLWDGTNETNGLHHLREQLKTFREGTSYQQFQYDLAFANRTNNQLVEKISKLESILEYEKEKNDDLARTQLEYQSDINRYQHQLMSSASDTGFSSPTPNLSIELVVIEDKSAQTVASNLTLHPVALVYEEIPIEPVFPYTQPQPVTVPIIQQPQPQLPENYHHHLSRSQKLDEIQGLLTKSMHTQGLLGETKHRATPNDVRKAIKYDLPELMQKALLLKALQNTFNSPQLDANSGYATFFPEEAAKTAGQISPQIYLRAVSAKVQELQGEIQRLGNDSSAVATQPGVSSTVTPSSFVNLSATVEQKDVNPTSAVATSPGRRTKKKAG